MASRLVNLYVKHEAEPLSIIKTELTLDSAGQGAPHTQTLTR